MSIEKHLEHHMESTSAEKALEQSRSDWVAQQIATHTGRYLEELKALLRIPSISPDPAFQESMWDCARYLQETFAGLPIQRTEIFPTAGHPVVYAETEIRSDRPTVLIYGHYDVVPPGELHKWETAPFEPSIRATPQHPRGAIFARGACDNKGQFFMHLKALELLHECGPLPCNIKFLIEGEEEVGSPHLVDFVAENLDLLACDALLISDSGIISKDLPSLTAGMKGLLSFKMDLLGPQVDLHSGVYGGLCFNPLNGLVQLLGTVIGTGHEIKVPGFFDQVQALGPAEQAYAAATRFDIQAFQEYVGLDHYLADPHFSPAEMMGYRPTVDLNGMWGGDQSGQSVGVIPSQASAKLSFRLVPGQDPDRIWELVQKHLQAHVPPGLQLKLELLVAAAPFLSRSDSPALRAAQAAMTQSFGTAPILARSGGSLPFLPRMEALLGCDTVLMGFGLGTDAFHGANEHFGIDNFQWGVQSIFLFHHFLAQTPSGSQGIPDQKKASHSE